MQLSFNQKLALFNFEDMLVTTVGQPMDTRVLVKITLDTLKQCIPELNKYHVAGMINDLVLSGKHRIIAKYPGYSLIL